MRSISAVLRITREQLESRGQLGSYPMLAALGAAVTVIASVAMFFTKDDMHELAVKTVYGAAAVTVLLLFGTFRVRHARKSNVYQEQEIRIAAVASLNEILAHDPKLKPLEREQVMTVKELIKKVQPSGELRRLLDA